MKEPYTKVYHSQELKEQLYMYTSAYVYKETGLTPLTVYNDNDFLTYTEALEEILPRELRQFLYVLYSFPAKEERELGSDEKEIEFMLESLTTLEPDFLEILEEPLENFLEYLGRIIEGREGDSSEEL
ncbi:MAG: hypothetical protein IKH78_04230 [Ruminococcus sp.]|nr:hypothetical protein [Clostridia bacterium]MBR6967723.1 hypothetical protein [Ruminococcus sp.]